jgi:hypothetical protein
MVFTRLNKAVETLMPNVSDSTTTSAKPGVRARLRAA